ncbi:MarR family winged helix-turn-helix transcriptional regulator [Aliiroseovarius sp. YM-037]|uniref:MarR family winged helix-turn-helix transcriptional regulator n=1 Tax=Aliiroseovarius sp. YM-037 TaxID=3341728 RepID=UPI003A7F6B5D
MSQKSDLLYEIALLSRPLHQQVDGAVAAMLSETRVTVRMRAVLEALDHLGPATVPGVARHLGIQRQYVQVMMNEVEDAGLVSRQKNPAHKRSTLFELSKGGRDIIAGIKNAEMSVISALARDFTLDEVEKAHHVTEHLLRGFRRLNEDLRDG